MRSIRSKPPSGGLLLILKTTIMKTLFTKCLRTMKAINNIEISPEMSFYDSVLRHKDYAFNTLCEAEDLDIYSENDREEIELILEGLIETLAYVRSAKELESITIKTQSLAIV